MPVLDQALVARISTNYCPIHATVSPGYPGICVITCSSPQPVTLSGGCMARVSLGSSREAHFTYTKSIEFMIKNLKLLSVSAVTSPPVSRELYGTVSQLPTRPIGHQQFARSERISCNYDQTAMKRENITYVDRWVYEK